MTESTQRQRTLTDHENQFAQADALAKATHLQDDHGMTKAALLAQLDAGTTLTAIHDTLGEER